MYGCMHEREVSIINPLLDYIVVVDCTELRNTNANLSVTEQNDPDKVWRVMYLSAAAVCCDDDKNSIAVAMEYVDKGR